LRHQGNDRRGTTRAAVVVLLRAAGMLLLRGAGLVRAVFLRRDASEVGRIAAPRRYETRQRQDQCQQQRELCDLTSKRPHNTAKHNIAGKESA
jgi:hypothetical protein